MVNQKYPDTGLAKDYLEFHKERSYGPLPKVYQVIGKRIAEVEEKIRAVFEKEGDLEKLDEKYIGPKIKKDLELILRRKNNEEEETKKSKEDTKDFTRGTPEFLVIRRLGVREIFYLKK